MNKKQREENEFKKANEEMEENKRRIWRSTRWIQKNIPKELLFDG